MARLVATGKKNSLVCDETTRRESDLTPVGPQSHQKLEGIKGGVRILKTSLKTTTPLFLLVARPVRC